ncbi:esterase [Ahniella affigens]|uniref:Esterase n=1 Tax=Ahniella affigens TaxID=2021234 RepID=A0A2P1PVL9_9GAMM|nr:alpha/beta hydrolase-fold protein [Ahniella affigens]AVP98870.1 esterase [Ahniella affigens]
MRSDRLFQQLLTVLILLLIATSVLARSDRSKPKNEALGIGDTWTLESTVLGEIRRINVYRPNVPTDQPLPVLYMPDGGIQEDFLHVAGLVQILSLNGGIRPFMLVGIENTQRRRDLTGPSTDPQDQAVAPVIGGSRAFRQFIRQELFPAVEARYRVTHERALIGESFAGLFVVETMLKAPSMFDSYLALDPSLWWNHSVLVNRFQNEPLPKAWQQKRLYLAHGSQSEIAALTETAYTILKTQPDALRQLEYRAFPDETHQTIYHPAALAGLRLLFAPPAQP